MSIFGCISTASAADPSVRRADTVSNTGAAAWSLGKSPVASNRRFVGMALFSLMLFLSIFLFLWLSCPQYLLYQEQNQLFLFTDNYFRNAVSVPGGFADWLSEFVVQFCYVPLYGALFIAFMLTLTQVFLGLACRRCACPMAAFILSALPVMLYVGAMGDENILLSLASAMMLTALFTYLYTIWPRRGGLAAGVALYTGFCMLYWLAGPIAFILISSYGILRRQPVGTVALLSWLTVRDAHRLWLQQYPLSDIMLGINYYRIPETYPSIFFVIACVMALVPLVVLVRKKESPLAVCAAIVAVAVFAFIYVPSSFDKDKSRILAYDSLVRQGRWTDIISRAEKENPSDHFSLQAVNLALAMTGQLPESMFRFEQKGPEGLIGKPKLDNTSQLITQEALFRLGLTNAAFLTAFDLQESIMNDRKSGRLMKRMAECQIVNGNYDVASKYIGILRKSLYYADWARQAEALLGNDSAVEAHPVYGPLRRNVFGKEAFYDSGQIDRICAILTADSEGANTLAWQYFCAAAMLRGDLDSLMGMCGLVAERFGLRQLPRHVQEAIALSWTFSHPTFDGIPFPISAEVRQTTADLARAMMANRDNPAAWKAAAPGSFGVYYVVNSLKHNGDAEGAPEYHLTDQ